VNRHQKRERGRRLRFRKLCDWALEHFGVYGALCVHFDMGLRLPSISNCRAEKRHLMQAAVKREDDYRKVLELTNRFRTYVFIHSNGHIFLHKKGTL